MDKKTTVRYSTPMYTKDMKRHLTRSIPVEFFKHPAYFRAFTLGMVYLFLVVAQLFTYEKFPGIVADYQLPGGEVVAVLLAGLIPFMEIAALPFLVSMRVSRRTRRISRIAMLIVPALWLIIGIWLAITASVTTESGLMGATIPVGSGLWLVAFSALLAWSAYLVNRELPARHSR